MTDLIHSEHDVLMHYLNKMRKAVVAASGSLTHERLRAPGVPSGTNLLGLMHHLTGVEGHWFWRVFLCENVECDMSMASAARVNDEARPTRSTTRQSTQGDRHRRTTSGMPRRVRSEIPARRAWPSNRTPVKGGQCT